jgi:hypothetical protein
MAQVVLFFYHIQQTTNWLIFMGSGVCHLHNNNLEKPSTKLNQVFALLLVWQSSFKCFGYM